MCQCPAEGGARVVGESNVQLVLESAAVKFISALRKLALTRGRRRARVTCMVGAVAAALPKQALLSSKEGAFECDVHGVGCNNRRRVIDQEVAPVSAFFT
jgi:hypothetical protein